MSAYQGWLLKIGDYVIDQSRFIAAESYQPAVNMQDVDPWTDANGYVHRNAVELKAISVDFSTPAMLQMTICKSYCPGYEATLLMQRNRGAISRHTFHF